MHRTQEEIREALIQRYFQIINEDVSSNRQLSEKKRFKDISNANLSEIKEAEISYYDSLVREMMLWISVPNNFRRILLEESETRTIDEVISRLTNNYNLKDWQFQRLPLKNNITGMDARSKLAILVPELNKNKQIICDVMTQEGYYLVQEFPTVIDDFETSVWSWLCFAPVQTENIASQVRKMKYAYHVTSKENLGNIFIYGLYPKDSKGTIKFPQRIYMWSEDEIESARNYAYSLFSYDSKESNSYVVLRISINDIPFDYDFYHDPMIQDAFFVTNHISSQAIEAFEFLSPDSELGWKIESTIRGFHDKMHQIEQIASENSALYIKQRYIITAKNASNANLVQQKLKAAGFNVSQNLKTETDCVYFSCWPG